MWLKGSFAAHCLLVDGMLWVRALEPRKAVLEPISLKSEFPAFCAFLPQNLHFLLNDLQKC
jgi:hypothetical protein